MSEVVSYSPPANVADTVTTGRENALKDLMHVLREVVEKVPHTWHSEAEKLDLRAKIDAYEKSALGVLKYEASRLGFDRAGNEDVSARVPAAPPAGQVTQQIDYQRLAAEMLKLQQAQSAPPPAAPQLPAAIIPTSVVTSEEQGGGAL